MAKFLISAFADEASSKLPKQIAALQRNGLGYIEPRNISGCLTKKNDEELTEIAQTLAAAGIKVSSLGSPIGKVTLDDDFDHHLEKFDRALAACKILGTNRMRMFSFYMTQEDLAKSRDEVMRRLNILLDRAEAAGIKLCHENESEIYGQNPAEVRDLLTTLPRLGGIFDAANYVQCDQDPIEGIEATIPSLEYIHIKDALFATHEVVPCGMGDGQLPEVLRRVDAATDETVFLSVEPHLHVFQAFADIDHREFRTGIDFASNDEAFDYAVNSLKKTLTELGFKEGEDKVWKK